MACIYTYDGNPPLSYQELITKLKDSDIEKALSILFKVKQDDIYDSIVQLKKEYKFK
jgi:uncharacterized protein YjgD (DUF1641 family)